MSRLATVSLFATVLLGATIATAAIVRHEPAKPAVEKTLRAQRNLARVQRTNAQLTNLVAQAQLEANRLTSESAADAEELRAFCKEAKVEYDDLIKGNVKLADDGTIVKPAPPTDKTTASSTPPLSPPQPQAKPTAAGVKP